MVDKKWSYSELSILILKYNWKENNEISKYHDLQLFSVFFTEKKKTHHIYGNNGIRTSIREFYGIHTELARLLSVFEALDASNTTLKAP